MKHCDKCNVTIRSNREYCPLCHQHLKGDLIELKQEIYPEFVPLRRQVLPFTKKLLRVVTIVAIVILLLFNWISQSQVFWSLIPIGGILYFWLLVRYGVLTNQNVPFRIAFLTTILVVVLVIYDVNYGVYANRDDMYLRSWALNYVLPLALLTADMAISFIIWLKRINYRDYLFYLMTILVFSFVPLLLYFLKIIRVVWPSIASFSVAILILMIIIFFFPKHIKDEIKKRFHL